MKRFTVLCKFGDKELPFHIYLGVPAKNSHPLKYQNAWLNEEKSSTIPEPVMENFSKLHAIAKEGNVNFENLLVYALGTNKKGNEKEKEKEKDAYDTASIATKKANVGQYLISNRVIEFSDVKDIFVKTERKAGKGANKIKTHAQYSPYEGTLLTQSLNKKAPSVLLPDSLHKKSFLATIDSCTEIAKEIWPDNTCNFQQAERAFFVAVAMYIYADPKKALTLCEIANHLMWPDIDYTLAVAMDTVGGILPIFSYSCLSQWLIGSKDSRRKLLFNTIAALFDFSIKQSSQKKDKYLEMRKALKELFLTISLKK